MAKNTKCVPSIEEVSQLGIDEIARLGAEQLLRSALEIEIALYMEKVSHIKREDGTQGIVRNGHHKDRKILVGCGSVEVSVPRTRNRVGTDEEFCSTIIPKYMRRSLRIDEAIPLLYLKGISTGNMEEALNKLFGDNDIDISASTVSRLKEGWKGEYEEWIERDLSNKRYCYLYADGIYTSVRFSDKKACLLVIIGVTEGGRKELVAVNCGDRESEATWEELLRDLQSRGMRGASLAIGDGALGFWKALQTVYPETDWQRCWVHKKRNILKRVPDSVHDEASRLVDNIFKAEKRADAETAVDAFVKRFEHTQQSAVKCLLDDKDVLLKFYDYPKQHWIHIRSTNPIESTFATVRLRTKSTRNMGTKETTFMMVFKLIQMAEKRWQRVFGYSLIPFVLEGQIYEDGELPSEEDNVENVA